jgi:electron transfer flavoprotein alpha subunit
MVLTFVELADGQVKKSSAEAVYFGSKVAELLQTSNVAVVLGQAQNLESLGRYGSNKVLHADSPQLNQANIMSYSAAIAELAQQHGAHTVIFAKSSLADSVAARVAAKLKAAIAANITELPSVSGDSITVKRSIYTGKAFAYTTTNSAKKVLTLKKNALATAETDQVAIIERVSVTEQASNSAVTQIAVHKASGAVSLPEADLVVSAGRGLKGPENWGIVEELAKALGAATACSKPVSDVDWRPHHEHVGQTGIKVSPNLYIACGISGAIQHLAGVNSSKVIVVINKDPEAPFFKAADYGIVGDVFDILPRLTKAVLAAK